MNKFRAFLTQVTGIIMVMIVLLSGFIGCSKSGHDQQIKIDTEYKALFLDKGKKTELFSYIQPLINLGKEEC